MDGFEEKKWFVYMGDHHEGPFSLAEIQTKMNQAQMTSSSYVWAEGMPDWKLMSEVSAFESLLGSRPAPAPKPPQMPSAFEEQEPEGVTLSDLHQPQPAAVEAQVPEMQAEPVTIQLQPAAHLNPDSFQKREEVAANEGHSERSPRSKRRSSRGLRMVLLLLVLGIGAGVYTGALDPVLKQPAVKAILQTASEASAPLFAQLERVPVLSTWLSPLPAIADISPAEYDELRSAAKGDVAGGGPKVALALSTADPQNPFFYVASNFPDGTRFEIHIDGVADTLLNQTSFSGKLDVTLTKKLASSGVLKAGDGQPLARGQYEIFVVEAAEQSQAVADILYPLQPVNARVPASVPKGFKLLATKSYFLGGAKDAMYAQRLKEFHDRLREKATTELSELKQFAFTFETQLAETTSKFTTVRGGPHGKATPAKKNAWAAYHQKWGQFATQATGSFQKWTPESLKNEFFYGNLYEQLQQTFKSVEDVHNVQNGFFTTATDPNTFDIQLGQAHSVASSAVAALKAKIDQAEKIPPTPNGMPRKEGL